MEDGHSSYVAFLNCRACLRPYPLRMSRSLTKFQELPDDCTCNGEGLAPVSSVPRVGGLPELVRTMVEVSMILVSVNTFSRLVLSCIAARRQTLSS